MHTLLPNHYSLLILTLCIALGYVLVGYVITKLKSYAIAISLSWSLLLLVTVFIERTTIAQPAGFRMLAIIFLMLLGMKIIVTVEYYKNKTSKLSLIQWLAFSLGWFGMRPNLFEELGKRKLSGGKELVISGIYRLLTGIAFILLAKWMAVTFIGYEYKILVTIFSLVGISLILHFGLLNISAGMWRFSGADTRTLFKAPLLATSLTEFWGKRWNLAFSEMTAIALYKPLKVYFGITTATIIAFLFSGLLHELAISVPVETGYGLPMLYFFIHGILLLIEKVLAQKGLPIGKNKWVGRAWVMFWLALPMPILFHKAFIKGVVWPLIQVYQG
jgi:hypothetical protein